VTLHADPGVEAVWIRVLRSGEEQRIPMRSTPEEGAAVWTGTLPLDASATRYRFRALTRSGLRHLNQLGVHRHTPDDAGDFVAVEPGPPAWVPDAVCYQIVPDRFADGDPASNVATGEYSYLGRPVRARRWGARPRKGDGPREFFGGDLPGIVQRLDHVRALGANTLYLTPIFESPSSHKYDPVTFDRVDPRLGGDAALVELRRALDSAGMRLILDAVWNHTGNAHEWFARARSDPDSPERAMYTFGADGDYATWLGVKSLPKLDYASRLVHERIYRARDSAARRWLRKPYRADGWRIDVAHMMGSNGTDSGNAELHRAIRRELKHEFPEAWIFGEHFFEATRWLQGDQEDGAMNYFGFANPVVEWLSGTNYLGEPVSLDAASLAAQLTGALARIPFAHALALYNLLSSHDLPRVLTRVGGDARLARLGAVLLATWVGVPGVYYGDEIGLEGGPDPDSRRCMPWDETRWDFQTLAAYRELLAARRVSPALRRGRLEILHAQGDVLAFLREGGGESIVVAVNRGRRATVVELPRVLARNRWYEVFGDGDLLKAGTRLALTVPSRGAAVFGRQG
jgi:alpha-glucosidase